MYFVKQESSCIGTNCKSYDFVKVIQDGAVSEVGLSDERHFIDDITAYMYEDTPIYLASHSVFGTSGENVLVVEGKGGQIVPEQESNGILDLVGISERNLLPSSIAEGISYFKDSEKVYTVSPDGEMESYPFP